MQDDTLGPDVSDCGEPPSLNGEPLHAGSCSDGVYGCRSCFRALRRLTDEQRLQWQAEHQEGPDTWQSSCEYCHKRVDIRDTSLLRPWDEPSCTYEVCSSCRQEHDADLRREIEYDEDRYSTDD